MAVAEEVCVASGVFDSGYWKFGQPLCLASSLGFPEDWDLAAAIYDVCLVFAEDSHHTSRDHTRCLSS